MKKLILFLAAVIFSAVLIGQDLLNNPQVFGSMLWKSTLSDTDNDVVLMIGSDDYVYKVPKESFWNVDGSLTVMNGVKPYMIFYNEDVNKYLGVNSSGRLVYGSSTDMNSNNHLLITSDLSSYALLTDLDDYAALAGSNIFTNSNSFQSTLTIANSLETPYFTFTYETNGGAPLTQYLSVDRDGYLRFGNNAVLSSNPAVIMSNELDNVMFDNVDNNITGETKVPLALTKSSENGVGLAFNTATSPTSSGTAYLGVFYDTITDSDPAEYEQVITFGTNTDFRLNPELGEGGTTIDTTRVAFLDKSQAFSDRQNFTDGTPTPIGVTYSSANGVGISLNTSINPTTSGSYILGTHYKALGTIEPIEYENVLTFGDDAIPLNNPEVAMASDLDDFLRLDGTNSPTANIDFNSFDIDNVGDLTVEYIVASSDIAMSYGNLDMLSGNIDVGSGHVYVDKYIQVSDSIQVYDLPSADVLKTNEFGTIEAAETVEIGDLLAPYFKNSGVGTFNTAATHNLVTTTVVGSKILPADTLQVGDYIRVNLCGDYNGSSTNQMLLVIGADTVMVSTAAALNSTGDTWNVTACFAMQVTKIGAAGEIKGTGNTQIYKDASSGVFGRPIQMYNSGEFDSTVDNEIKLLYSMTGTPILNIYTLTFEIY